MSNTETLPGYCRPTDDDDWLCVGCGDRITRPAYCFECRYSFSRVADFDGEPAACRLCGSSKDLQSDMHLSCLRHARALLLPEDRIAPSR